MTRSNEWEQWEREAPDYLKVFLDKALEFLQRPEDEKNAACQEAAPGYQWAACALHENRPPLDLLMLLENSSIADWGRGRTQEQGNLQYHPLWNAPAIPKFRRIEYGEEGEKQSFFIQTETLKWNHLPPCLQRKGKEEIWEVVSSPGETNNCTPASIQWIYPGAYENVLFKDQGRCGKVVSIFQHYMRVRYGWKVEIPTFEQHSIDLLWNYPWKSKHLADHPVKDIRFFMTSISIIDTDSASSQTIHARNAWWKITDILVAQTMVNYKIGHFAFSTLSRPCWVDSELRVFNYLDTSENIGVLRFMRPDPLENIHATGTCTTL